MNFKPISFADMLREIVSCILDGAPFREYYWKDGDNNLHEIVELDLLRGRFVTDNEDFSEFEWEIKESRIYVKE